MILAQGEKKAQLILFACGVGRLRLDKALRTRKAGGNRNCPYVCPLSQINFQSAPIFSREKIAKQWKRSVVNVGKNKH